MPVTRAQFLSLLEPKLRAVKNDINLQSRRPVIYTQFYGESMQSRKATETYYHRAGLGDFAVKAEAGLISYTDPISGGTVAFSHVRRSNGYKISQEMLDHDQYAEIVKLEQDLQIAGAEDLEIGGHLLLNNAFGTTDNATYGFKSTGLDGVGLCSTAHTRLDGGANQANKPSTDANLSWTSLANGRQQFQLLVDNRGRRIIAYPRKLVIHVNDELTAMELLRSSGKPGTANNDINALFGEFSVVVTPYLTDTNSWFLFGDNVETVWHWDVQPRTAMEDDFDTEVVKRKRVHGFSMGHTRWHGVYGTSGTT
jgi:hypothetical protein